MYSKSYTILEGENICLTVVIKDAVPTETLEDLLKEVQAEANELNCDRAIVTWRQADEDEDRGLDCDVYDVTFYANQRRKGSSTFLVWSTPTNEVVTWEYKVMA